MALPWFRMWAEAVDDEKLRLLAFEDRWHFVALLCLKAQGVLDERNPALRRQKICIKLGLDSLELETVMKRLVTVGLVTSKGQPVNWGKRQFQSDSSTNRVRAFRERSRNVSETDQIQIQIQKQNIDTETEALRSSSSGDLSPSLSGRFQEGERLQNAGEKRRAVASLVASIAAEKSA